MKPKKVPQRMCIGCQEMKPKKELVRVVKNKEGQISIDLKGKAPGRGAYICKCTKCLDMAVKAKKLERTFETAIPNDVYEKLREELLNSQGEE